MGEVGVVFTKGDSHGFNYSALSEEGVEGFYDGEKKQIFINLDEVEKFIQKPKQNKGSNSEIRNDNGELGSARGIHSSQKLSVQIRQIGILADKSTHAIQDIAGYHFGGNDKTTLFYIAG